MTPQLQQAVKLLQLSRLELSQVLSQELAENPLLEESLLEADETEGSPQEETGSSKASEEEEDPDDEARERGELWDELLEPEDFPGRTMDGPEVPDGEPFSYEQTLSRSVSLQEHLLSQLRMAVADEQERTVGQAIIGNLDDDGYLRTPLEEIATMARAKPDEAERLLKIVQSLDPPGVAARDLRECLLLQIGQRGLSGSAAERIVQDHLKDLEHHRYSVIAKRLGIGEEEVHAAVRTIARLEPKPGRPFFSGEAQTVVPDVFVIKSQGEYKVMLNDEGLPRLRVNPYYRKLLQRRDATQEKAKGYLQERLRSAVWMIRCIEQRNRTICRVAESIVRFQRDFFENGISHLRPLILKQVAEEVGMHESTVSRVTNQKYMHTPQGLYPFKYFFGGSLPSAGENGAEISAVTVRDIMRRLIEREDPRNPLKDQEIVAKLDEQKIAIARRTVAKYRAELRILPAEQRRKPK
jgi:RNA polymerase sigma-54 factor